MEQLQQYLKLEKELQRKSELLKEQKIKKIKDNLKLYFAKFELPVEIENIIISYSFDKSKIETNKSLIKKVRKYYKTNEEHLISELDVSCVTNMECMFWDFHDFNQPLDKWDTSNVANMHSMFWNCRKFNQPLNNWNTSNVVNMSSMFVCCYEFNQPLNKWNTSNVIYMRSMFECCYKFNQLLNSWDISKVINKDHIFYKCKSLETEKKMLMRF